MIGLEINKMHWDSEFWGVNFYNADKSCNLLDFKQYLNNELSDIPFVIQSIVSEDDIHLINSLEDNGFRFVESKMNLVKNVKDMSMNNEIDLSIFQDVREKDLIRYKDEFYTLYGKVSRFASFGEKKVNDFYYKWAKKSINGKLDDRCIGYYSNNILKGFITYRIINYKLIIGLVGVYPEYQGKKISQYLLDYVTNIAVINNCNEINVSTQGKNTKAINAYIRNGFLIDNIKHWYYYKGGL